MNKTNLDSRANIDREITRARWFTLGFSANGRIIGIIAALTSACFLGMTPIFGKQAILMGVPPLALAAVRTLLACFMLLIVIASLDRHYLYIYPAGLLGCLMAGWINGIGSLFYYSALARINAGIGQLLYSLYPFFLILWLALDRQIPGPLTLLRVMIAIGGVYFITWGSTQQIDPIGVIQMLIASALYALHIPINQRVLSDMPAPTVTVYTLIAMSSVVLPAYLLSGADSIPHTAQAWWPIVALTLVTFFSRLTLFLGIKHLGSLQAGLLGLSELIVTLLFANLLLGETLTPQQWVGSILLISSLLLIIFEKTWGKKYRAGGWLSWISPPSPPSEIPWQ
jgi:drug/metabolite transporter (DMT)-like permease